MRTLILNIEQALKLHESGGYASLRTNESIAVIVELESNNPLWIAFMSPSDKIWGMRFRTSDFHGAKEGAIYRNLEMLLRIKKQLPVSAIYGLAPLPVVDACKLDTNKSLLAGLWGYYHLSAFVAEDMQQAQSAVKGAEAWLRDFPCETIRSMDDIAFEGTDWLMRADSQRLYGRLLFAIPAVAQGMRGASIEQICGDLKQALQAGVSLESLQLDPRFLRVPKFSLGLINVKMASSQVAQRTIQISELRAQLVESLDSPLLFDDVVAERMRLDDEYRNILLIDQDAGSRIRSSLDRYISRWAEPLAKAVIID